jgi:pentatricopeptide repeat domain-containing protein 1
MIALYGKRGRVDKATETLTLMKATGLAPDLVTYNCMMSMYGREGMYRKAEQLLRDMVETGNTPDLVSYNTVIFSYRSPLSYHFLNPLDQ